MHFIEQLGEALYFVYDYPRFLREISKFIGKHVGIREVALIRGFV